MWTRTNEIMNLVIQHEYYRELISGPLTGRDVEADAVNEQVEGENVYV